MAILTRTWGEHVFVPTAVQGQKTLSLTSDEKHHLMRVLRMREGDIVTAVNGNGVGFQCRIGQDGRLDVHEELMEYGEELRSSVLCCANMKSDSQREIVETATCLGVRRIIFFDSERSEAKWDHDKPAKLARVAVAAMKQCGRSRLPTIEYFQNLSLLLNELCESCACFAAHPLASEPSNSVRDVSSTTAKALFVGAEGGFSDREIELLESKNVQMLDLGIRRLRTELAVTAGLIAIRNL